MIRVNIEPHERHNVYYKRKPLRHFAEYSNSAHEGTNHGLKYCADAVNPSNLLDISSQRLSFQGERNYGKFVSESGSQLEQYKSWNELKCSKELVPKGAALLLQEFTASDNYVHKKVNDRIIYVRYKKEQKINENSPVAKWGNVRKVMVTENTVKCFCLMFQRDGLICRRLIYIFKLINHTISHHDIDVRWWIAYAVYTYSIENGTDDLDDILTEIRKKI